MKKGARRFSGGGRSAKRQRLSKPKTAVTMGRGFPKRLTFTHTYADTIQITSNVGIANSYVFSANSLYDPDISGGGHQPLYFDQLTPLYDHYVVIGSKIKATIVPTTASTVPIKVALYLNDDSSPVSQNPIDIAEQTGASCRILTQGQSNPITLTKGFSAKKVFGGSILSNVELQGTSGAAPVEQSDFILAMQPMDATSTVAVFVNFVVTYTAVWKELKDVAKS